MPMTLEQINIIGSENINQQAFALASAYIDENEGEALVASFHWGDRVIIVTRDQVIVSDADQLIYQNRLGNRRNPLYVRVQGRSLVFMHWDKEVCSFSFKEQETAESLGRTIKEGINAHAPGQETNVNPEPIGIAEPATNMDPESAGIAERVRFWEEQEVINRELIPRVIQQNQILTNHIADHENLPLVVGKAVAESQERMRAEQVETANRLRAEQTAAISSAANQVMERLRAEQVETATQLRIEQADAITSAVHQVQEEHNRNLNETMAQLRSEQTRITAELQAELDQRAADAVRATRSEDDNRLQHEIDRLRAEQSQRDRRNRLVSAGTSAAAIAISLTAIIISIL